MSKATELPPLLSPPVLTHRAVQRFVDSGTVEAAPKRRMQLYLSQETFRALSMYCAKKDLSFSDVAEKAVLAWLKERGALEI